MALLIYNASSLPLHEIFFSVYYMSNQRGASTILPRNMWRELSTAANSKTRASLARIFGLPKQMYLPVLKRSPVVSREHHVLNRSRIMKYPGYIGNSQPLDFHFPAAYKNKEWKYYFSPTRNVFVFYNTKNGPPIFINKKTGARDPNSQQKYTRFMNRIGMNPHFRFNLISRKPLHDTWNAYLRRLREAPREDIHGKVNLKLKLINEKLKKYKLNHNIKIFNNVPSSDLLFFLKERHNYKPQNKIYNKSRLVNLITYFN